MLNLLAGYLFTQNNLQDTSFLNTSPKKTNIPIKRVFTGDAASKRAKIYRSIYQGLSYKFTDKPGEINVLLIRNCDFELGPKETYDKFGDLLVVISRDNNSRYSVSEFRCTTRPGNRISGGKKNLGMVLPGQYPYETTPQRHRDEWGALRSLNEQALPGARDVNGDGVWSSNELKRKSSLKGVNFHWVGPECNRQNVNGWSMGCFVLPLTRKEFIDNFIPCIQTDRSKTVLVTLIDSDSSKSALAILSNLIEKELTRPSKTVFAEQIVEDKNGKSFVSWRLKIDN